MRLQSELEQLQLLVKIKMQKTKGQGRFNQLRVTGSNINGSLGIGSEEESSDKLHQLTEFNNKKIYSLAVGDFHTLAVVSGCNCVNTVKDKCKGQFECNGGSDIFGWGFNIHGQVNGHPSELPVLTPKIIPFFVGKRQVQLVAACRSRSLAITTDNNVYEWGFTGSERDQFEKLYDLPEAMVDVQLGTEFNLFLAKTGVLWMSGQITQEGENVVNTFDGLINLSDKMPEKERVLFKKIQCGYSHALLIDNDDKVYSFGAGLYGQLGLGADQLKTKWPVAVQDVNEGSDKVLKVACGANFSVCYTELGILYYWGMLVPEDFDSIQWLPNFMNISLPKGLNIEESSFLLADIKATFREVLACDVQGRVYHSDLNCSQTLKPLAPKVQQQIGFAHKLHLGRSCQLYMDTLLSPSACKIEEYDSEMETLTDNILSIKLINSEGEFHYVDPEDPQLPSNLPIVLVLNKSDNLITTDYSSFDYLSSYKGAKDTIASESTILEALYFGAGEFNKCPFKIAQKVNPQDHSVIDFTITPSTQGPFCLHVRIGKQEIRTRPIQITIVKSEQQRQLDELEEQEREKLRLEKLKKQQEKQQMKKDKEDDKLRQQRLKEEALRKKREETEKRAKEAVLRAKEAKDSESLQKEEERKLRKEQRTGGGFNLNKAKKV